MLPEIDTYLKRTGQAEDEILSGVSAYGLVRVVELVKQAESENKKLVFFYESEKDEAMDKQSYRFE